MLSVLYNWYLYSCAQYEKVVLKSNKMMHKDGSGHDTCGCACDVCVCVHHASQTICVKNMYCLRTQLKHIFILL